jgi:hypothetical protein
MRDRNERGQVMSSDAHKQTLDAKNQKQLNRFIKSGRRKGARRDFESVLKKAAGAKNGNS